MSTFVFAPSWVTYPNHSKTLKEEIDEFPTLLSHNNNNNNNNNNNSKKDNVWSNPSLIQKIQKSSIEEEDIEDTIENYELERLKALVPKTKKLFSSTNKRNINSSKHYQQHQVQPTIIKNKKPTSSPITITPPPTPKEYHTTNIKIIPTTTNTTTNTIIKQDIVKEIQPTKYYISKQEQQHFIYFIKSWTSTRITSTSNNYRDFNLDNSCHSSDTTSDSSFHSEIDMNHSFFQYDPFPIHP